MERVKRKLGSHRRFHQRLLGGLQRSFGSPEALQVELPKDEDSYMTDMETFINVLKCAFGTGCLAMPQAFLNAGWLTGLVMTVVLGAFVYYAIHVLLSDIIAMEKRFGLPLLSYGESMEVALGKGPKRYQFLARPMRYLVDILLSMYHFGVDCVYVVFMAKILKSLGDIYLWPLDVRLYMALLLPSLILTFVIRKLRRFVPLAFVSNIMIAIGFVITLGYLVRDLPEFRELPPIQPIKNLPLVFGTLLFSIDSVGVILALRHNMKKPGNFLGACGVLNRGMAVVIIFYAGFGFLGFWRYGQFTASSVLHNLPIEEIPTQLVAGLFAVGIFFSYALEGYVTMDILWQGYLEPEMEEGNASKTVEYLVRIALVIASVLVAIQYPDFGLLLAFVGSFCLAQLGFIFPGILDLCFRYEDGYGPGRIVLWRSMVFIAVGLAGCVAGTVSTLRNLNDQYPIMR